jgi:hypothetical protein
MTMQKEIVAHGSEPAHFPNGYWMNLENARVRLTSEDAAWPIESALKDQSAMGWKAAQGGPQTIWIDFDVPQPIHELKIRFEVRERRTQEFVLLCSNDGGQSYREIVRQQFNFSPEAATTEEETYFPRLAGVTGLKLTIIPDISGGDVRATLRALRIR